LFCNAIDRNLGDGCIQHENYDGILTATFCIRQSVTSFAEPIFASSIIAAQRVPLAACTLQVNPKRAYPKSTLCAQGMSAAGGIAQAGDSITAKDNNGGSAITADQPHSICLLQRGQSYVLLRPLLNSSGQILMVRIMT
jgi:hypothetical protein